MLNKKRLSDKFLIYETNHAISVLEHCFTTQMKDIVQIMDEFVLSKKDILTKGGGKSLVSKRVDSFLYNRGWVEKEFDVRISVDGKEKEIPTHKVDCFKNRVALEVEWNNKEPFYDRDLNNFRLLHQLDAISVGVIFTRATELQAIFKKLGKGDSYGPSTTHHGKLLPKLKSGGAGGCPVLVIAIKPSCYKEK